MASVMWKFNDASMRYLGVSRECTSSAGVYNVPVAVPSIRLDLGKKSRKHVNDKPRSMDTPGPVSYWPAPRRILTLSVRKIFSDKRKPFMLVVVYPPHVCVGVATRSLVIVFPLPETKDRKNQQKKSIMRYNEADKSSPTSGNDQGTARAC